MLCVLGSTKLASLQGLQGLQKRGLQLRSATASQRLSQHVSSYASNLQWTLGFYKKVYKRGNWQPQTEPATK